MCTSIKRICQITTAHPRYDIRIFHKECITLSKIYSVCLIVADGKGDEIKDNVQIIDVGKINNSRLRRFFCTTNKAYKKAKELDCDLYHFHDPEFLFYGLMLIRKGKKVIYDVHEDVPKQTLSKDYINPVFRKFIATIIGFTERIISHRLSSIITVTESINSRFGNWNSSCSIINNFPEFNNLNQIDFDKKRGICYVGNISSIRGIDIIMDSLGLVDIEFHLAGEFENDAYRKKIQSHQCWQKVKYYGAVDIEQAKKIMESCIAGLVTYLPVPNHLEAQPNKMFEYMAAGTPVIASDFPLWKEIIMKSNCGICINPLDPKSIAESINYIIQNTDKAREMSANGLAMVNSKFNWNSESVKLTKLYAEVLES